ncbi:hypothetical protein C0J52_20669 [Blattella germanica]|nr:hypothetical protein C0J52_20669 [Blattella germanica]
MLQEWADLKFTVNFWKAFRGRHPVYTNDSAGQRMIVVHAGGDMGFIPDAYFMYRAKSKCGDYHNEMNNDNYGLPEGSTVVMDNAPYHNKLHNRPPTLNSMKSDMQQWLTDNNVVFDADMRKP